MKVVTISLFEPFCVTHSYAWENPYIEAIEVPSAGGFKSDSGEDIKLYRVCERTVRVTKPAKNGFYLSVPSLHILEFRILLSRFSVNLKEVIP